MKAHELLDYINKDKFCGLIARTDDGGFMVFMEIKDGALLATYAPTAKELGEMISDAAKTMDNHLKNI